MKKKLLLFVLLFAGLMSVKAADGTLSVNVRNAFPGKGGELDVVLSGTDVTYTGFQFNITLPAGFTITGYEKGALITDHNINYSKPGDANMWIFIGNSGTVSPFSALNGVLVTVKFTIDGSVALGEQTGGKLEECDMSESSTSHTATGSTFSITTTDVWNLYEDAATAPAAMTGVKVKVNRTLESGKWNTICLPFPMTEAQVDAAFGSDVQIGDFNGYDTDADDNIKVKFTKATAIEANHPYIIKVSSTVNGFGVTDATVDISPKTGTKINDMASVNKGTNNKPKAMVGVYEPTTLADGLLYIKSDRFWYSAGGSKLLPYRAYFSFTDFDYEANIQTTAAPRFRISYDEISTGIKVVSEKKAEDNQYYNLQGCKVSNPTKGLYIVNGKKVIVK